MNWFRFFSILIVAAIIAWIVGLIWPKIYNGLVWPRATRKVISLYFSFISIALIVGLSMFIPNSTQASVQADASSNTTPSITVSPASSVSASPSASTSPQPTPTTSTAPSPAPAAPVQPSSCNPNYSPCIPNSDVDLDCSDIGMSVKVTGTDVYRLDRDGDGIGCDSY